MQQRNHERNSSSLRWYMAMLIKSKNDATFDPRNGTAPLMWDLEGKLGSAAYMGP